MRLRAFFLLFAMLALVLGSAAASTFPLFPGNGAAPGTQFEDDDVEYFVDNDGDGLVSVGDYIFAAMEMTQGIDMLLPFDPASPYRFNQATDELVAWVSLQVVNNLPTDPPGRIRFAPIGATPMLQFFQGGADLNVFGDPTRAAAAALATDGTAVWAFSVTGDADTEWFLDPIAGQPLNQPLLIQLANPVTKVGVANFALAQVAGSPDFASAALPACGTLFRCNGNGQVDLFGSSDILGGGGLTNAFARSDADVAVNPKGLCQGSIGDYVWQDLNHDGTQQPDEPGINNVVVKLYDGQGNFLKSDTTHTSSNAGYYQFTGLCQGNYQVIVDSTTVPTGLTPTSPTSMNGSDGVPLDSNEPTGTVVNLPTDNTSNQTVDFGYVSPCSGVIGDYVWQDLNHNGTQDDGVSSGINDVIVLLTGSDIYGQPVNLSSTTANNGYYQFNGLCQGTYQVSVNSASVPTGLLPTAPRSTDGNDGASSDSNEPLGTTVTLSSDNTSNLTVDFGYISPCSGTIGDYVWKDLDQNGAQNDGAASGINNVQVVLTGNDVYGQSISKTTTTTNNPNPGYYQFSGLCAGDYLVTVNTGTVPSGLVPTSPRSTNGNDGLGNDSNEPNGTLVNLGADSSSNQTVDFGYIEPCTGTIGDFVWVDLNGNGIQDDGAASGINDVQVLLNGTNVYGQAVSKTYTTANQGYYLFSNLCAGDYTVSINSTTVPSGLLPTSPRSPDGNDLAELDSNEPVGTTLKLSTDSSSNKTIDFGYVQPVSASCVSITALQGIAITPVTMTASGGVPPYTYSASGLPAGLTMSSGGTISGTPSVSGTFNYTVTVTDSAGNIGTFNCSVTVGTKLNLTCTTCGSAKAYVGTTFSYTLTVTGGVAPYTFSVISGSLPPGLSLNPSTGEINGTPTAAGTYDFRVKVVDSQGNWDTADCSVVVYKSPIYLSCGCYCGDETGKVGTYYSGQLTVTGGTSPYSFSIISGSLPPGLTLNATTGKISGTPTTPGTYNFTAKVVDAKGYSDTANCSIVIYGGPLNLTCGACGSNVGMVGTPYSVQLAATGGTAPYTYYIYYGSLPPGLALDPKTGVISGTPTKAGTYSFTAKVVDSKGNYDKADCTIVIKAGIQLSCGNCGSNTGAVGVAYSEQLVVSNGTSPYTFSIVSGSLPDGLTLNTTTGKISGTPTTPGTYNFTAKVVDAKGYSDTANCSIVIYGGPLNLTCGACGSNVGVVGTPYSVQLAATGGTAPYIYYIYYGSLPSGLTLDKYTGKISGTPDKAGTYSFTAKVVDSKGNYDKADCTIVIKAGIQLSCGTCGSSSSGKVGTAYSGQFTVSNGTGPYIYSIASGSLPAGLTLNSATGAITGTPTTVGTYTFTAKVVDAKVASDTVSCTITIAAAAPLSLDCYSAYGYLGKSFSKTPAVSGGVSGKSYSIVSGSLPAGLTLNTTTGVVSGTPTKTGSYHFTMKVIDANGSSDTATDTITIYWSW